jgi:hypothetical protein
MEMKKMNETSTRFGGLQIGILILGLITALVHLVLLNVDALNREGTIDILFTLNGLGYLALLGAYFLPMPVFQNNRNLLRWVFIVYAAVTIVAWIIMGNFSRNLLGYGTKLDELLLIVLLFLDRR